MILASQHSIHRLPQIKSIYMDMTYFGQKNGILVSAEKKEYKINEKKYKRCIHLVYVFTKDRDQMILKKILLYIKLHVLQVTGLDLDIEKFYCLLSYH